MTSVTPLLSPTAREPPHNRTGPLRQVNLIRQLRGCRRNTASKSYVRSLTCEGADVGDDNPRELYAWSGPPSTANSSSEATPFRRSWLLSLPRAGESNGPSVKSKNLTAVGTRTLRKSDLRQGNMVTIHIALIVRLLLLDSHASSQACQKTSAGMPGEQHGDLYTRIGKGTWKVHMVPSYSMGSPTDVLRCLRYLLLKAKHFLCRGLSYCGG